MLGAATDRLAAPGVASPRVDAELLLAHVLHRPRGRLLSATAPTADQLGRFEGLLGRRVAREPLQHLTGSAPFRHLDLAVGPGVFIPRPETELLVDVALSALPRDGRPVVVDLAAGSGALGLAVATERPDASVTLVELDPDALEWLRRNARQADVRVVAGDIRDPGLLCELDATVDVVLSNPPYVPSCAEVDPEVGHDPAQAVFAGPDGLLVMPAVIAAAARLLRAGGVLVVEHDDTHAPAVSAMLSAGGWSDVREHDDLTGRPRFASAYRRRLTP